MKESKIMSALRTLQDNLVKSAKEYRERNAYTKNPPVYTYNAGDKVDHETQARVMKQRSMSIMAEMRKAAREETLDTEALKTELENELNAFLRSFKFMSAKGIPEEYSLSQNKDVLFELTVQNTGYRYRWGVDNKEPISLRVSAKVQGIAGAPEVADCSIELPIGSKEGDDDHNAEYVFANLVLPYEGFFRELSSNKYVFEFNLYEGDSHKFTVSFDGDVANNIVFCNVGE